MRRVIDEDVLTTVEAASLIGVTKQTIMNWIRNATIPVAYKVGGRVLIPVTALDNIKREYSKKTQ